MTGNRCRPAAERVVLTSEGVEEATVNHARGEGGTCPACGVELFASTATASWSSVVASRIPTAVGGRRAHRIARCQAAVGVGAAVSSGEMGLRVE